MKVLTIAGARPNFMKVAPLLREMRKHPLIKSVLIHTGQHYDPNLSDVFFDELGIPSPHYNLGIGSLPRDEQIQKIGEAFEPVLLQEQPSVIIVVGDVNSTVACAEVARRHGVIVAHVEAGLRSFDLEMPEEHNRIQTDKISDLLFVTEQSGMENLEREAVPGKAFLVGNVMIDTLVYSLPEIRKSTILNSLNLEPRRYIAATFHRPSNVDSENGLKQLFKTISRLGTLAQVVLPLHPRTRAAFVKYGLLEALQDSGGIQVIEPLGYFDFLRLVQQSLAVVTDSGGIQEETTYLGVPCLTLRANTERPATVHLGTNLLVGQNPDLLFAELERVVRGTFKKGTVPPLWDGQAATRIIDLMVEHMVEHAA